jgi:hypothetical protein
VCRRTVARHVHKCVHHHRQLVLHRRQVHRIHAGRDLRSIDPAVCVGLLFDTASRRRASYPQLSHNSANRTGQAQGETERPPERQAPWPSPFVALYVLQDAVPSVPPPRPHAVSRDRGSRCQDLSARCGSPTLVLRRSGPCVVQKTLWSFQRRFQISPVPPHPAPRHNNAAPLALKLSGARPSAELGYTASTSSSSSASVP